MPKHSCSKFYTFSANADGYNGGRQNNLRVTSYLLEMDGIIYSLKEKFNLYPNSPQKLYTLEAAKRLMYALMTAMKQH